jgi:hypothetical protein
VSVALSREGARPVRFQILDFRCLISYSRSGEIDAEMKALKTSIFLIPHIASALSRFYPLSFASPKESSKEKATTKKTFLRC